eukprot:7371238-Alexandrium_andersonii.AAC.1
MKFARQKAQMSPGDDVALISSSTPEIADMCKVAYLLVCALDDLAEGRQVSGRAYVHEQDLCQPEHVGVQFR